MYASLCQRLTRGLPTMKSLEFKLRLFLNKLFWEVVRPIRPVYWWVCRPERRGVKCIVVYANELPLVRPNYAHRLWTFPGGGVKRRESWKDAALRETEEETGVRVGNAVKIGEYFSTTQYARNTVQVFQETLDSRQTPRSDGIEIADAAWFALDHLPKDRVSRVDETIAAFMNQPPRPAG